MAHLEWTSFLQRLDYNLPLAHELSVDFMQGLQPRVLKLENALQGGENKRVEYAAHFLRGFIAPYGGSELLLFLRSLEEQSRQGQELPTYLPTSFLSCVQQMEGEVQEKIGWLEGALNDSDKRT